MGLNYRDNLAILDSIEDKVKIQENDIEYKKGIVINKK